MFALQAVWQECCRAITHTLARSGQNSSSNVFNL